MSGAKLTTETVIHRRAVVWPATTRWRLFLCRIFGHQWVECCDTVRCYDCGLPLEVSRSAAEVVGEGK